MTFLVTLLDPRADAVVGREAGHQANGRHEAEANTLGRYGMNITWPAPRPAVVPPSSLPHQAIAARVKVLHVITRFVDGSGGNTLLSVLGADRTRYELW